jgi:hypothetical protein
MVRVDGQLEAFVSHHLAFHSTTLVSLIMSILRASPAGLLRVLVLAFAWAGAGALEPGFTRQVSHSFAQSLRAASQRGLLLTLGSSVLLAPALLAPAPSFAQDTSQMREDSAYDKSIFNTPPGVTEYPAALAGTWRTAFTFRGAQFTPQIPLKTLSKDPNVPGFRKYSVSYVADIGADCVADLRFAPKDGKVVESRESTLASLITAFAVGDSAQVQSVVVEERGNRCTVLYSDAKGSGKIEMFTNSRTWRIGADGSFECMEQLRQYNVRQSSSSRGTSQVLGDYGLRWVFVPVPGTVDAYTGQLNVLSYLQPNDELYFQRLLKPVGVFTYKLAMRRVA